MPDFTIASVPYINAIPLVMQFEAQGDASPVRVLYDVPSKLPQLLDDRVADAIMVSSVDALRVPGRTVADGVCIGSWDEVQSVRLFSKTPFAQIESLALDQASMTSNRLAQLVLAEAYGVRPRTLTLAPELDSMLAVADACVLIGDPGMSAKGDGLHVLDLGQAWHALTGKPFVWAAWIGREDLDPKLVGLLQQCAAWSGFGRRPLGSPQADRQRAMLNRARAQGDWPEETIWHYYQHTMEYRLDEPMLVGWREFATRLQGQGFADCVYFPRVVKAASQPVR